VPARLQFLTLDAAPRPHREQARLALAGGVRWIQLRAKGLAHEAWLAEARAIAGLCRDHGAIFIVNDAPAVALAAEADGVHLGGDDAAPAAARALLGESALIGVTLNEPAHVARFAGVSVAFAGRRPFRLPLRPAHARSPPSRRPARRAAPMLRHRRRDRRRLARAPLTRRPRRRGQRGHRPGG